MRDIRFRAWEKKMKKMFYSGDSIMPDLTANGCPVHHFTRINLSMEFELMQFTGLKDKQGKDIYEGDIVKYHKRVDNHGYGSSEYIAEVKFGEEENTAGQFVAHSGNGFRNLLVAHYKIEILGNIYENPELLEQK